MGNNKGGSNKKEWTDDEVMELIHLYEEHEFLWNVKHKYYRNRDKRLKILDDIAEQFDNCDVNEVQRKIHNLRNQVSHEMKKLKNYDAEEGYMSKWKFFSALKFIVPSLTQTQSTSNLQVILTEDSPDEQVREPTPKRRKLPAKKASRPPEEGIPQEKIYDKNRPRDDFDRFGDYVAMELKNIKSDRYRGQLKSAIRKAIVQFSDLDEKKYWRTHGNGPYSSTSSAEQSRSPTPTLDHNLFK